MEACPDCAVYVLTAKQQKSLKEGQESVLKGGRYQQILKLTGTKSSRAKSHGTCSHCNGPSTAREPVCEEDVAIHDQ